MGFCLRHQGSGKNHSTGVLGNSIREKTLVISTGRGMIVITGCAHPGIAHIVQTVKELNADNIMLVI